MAAQYMPNSGFELRVRQQPKYARVAVGKEKGTDRKPIDPPPIVQLVQQGRRDPNSNFLQSPYLILTARLVSPKDEDSSPDDQSPSPSLKENALSGTVVSSLYSLKDTDNTQGGFFVFGDLSVRKEGHYRLEFTLYELKLQDRECWMLCRILSDKFQVYSHKEFPGMAESTFLTRSFSDQGVRLRLRKDSRSITTRKRNHSVAQGVDQLRAAGAHMYGGVHSPEQSPTGHPHAQYRRSTSLHDGNLTGSTLDRSRASMTPGGTGYFADSPQMRNDYNAGSYGYAGYEERSAKRHRVDSGISSHGYEDSYSAYPQPAPRTVPEMAGNLYPMSTGYQMAPQPAMSGLPVPSNPSPYTSMPRLNTQMAPQHHGTPNSAGASPFSPNAQRSPGASYQYPPSGAMYSASMPYQQGGTPPLPQPNGLGLVGMPSLDPEVEKQSTVTPGI